MINTGRKHLVHIVKYRWWWMLLTTILIVPGIIAMIYSSVTYSNHAPLKVGIDYTGGTILQYGLEQKLENSDVTKTREALEGIGIENPYIQILNVNNSQQKNTKSNINSIISIRTKFIDKGSDDADKITAELSKDYQNPELISVSSVGPTMGKELFKNSLIAITLAFLGIVAYLSFRFRFDYALAAILGVLHDVLFVVGIFSILGLVYNVQIDGLFITAILTVIGFSVHDTIVVFDRIRENLRYYSKKMSFGEIVDASVNQTLTRSINTSLTTLITLLALYFFGGVTTRDFVLCMILGIAIGTYSSIFFCSMLVDFWNDKKQSQTA
ncbi:MAG: protein-export membrane protein SecF [Candidatus Melainabacteria bacterium 35_41]|jgi:protein-export membrane protein, secD/secF family|nr:MAG: protein-export membrane protein SecF [Candidatus Melainabacteria bacterium 35_41]